MVQYKKSASGTLHAMIKDGKVMDVTIDDNEIGMNQYGLEWWEMQQEGTEAEFHNAYHHVRAAQDRLMSNARVFIIDADYDRQEHKANYNEQLGEGAESIEEL